MINWVNSKTVIKSKEIIVSGNLSLEFGSFFAIPKNS